MQRPLALLLALCLLAGLGWLGLSLLSEDAPARAAGPGAAPRAAAAPAVAPQPAALEHVGPAEGEPQVAADRTERVGLSEASTSGARLERTLRVVDRADGRPVAGARIAWTQVESGEGRSTHPALDFDRCDAWLSEHGQAGESGADGTLVVALDPGAELVALARAEGRAARATAKAEGDEVIELALVPDGVLDVLVLDAAGAPVEGVGVALTPLDQAWGFASGVHRRASDAAGRVRYAHVGLRVDLGQRPWAVGLPDVLGGPARVPLDPLDLPREPVVLALPATGAVEVAVDAPPGVPMPANLNVSLLFDEGLEDERLSFWTRPESIETALVDGRARFEHVALGRDLVVEAGGSYRGIPTRARMRGPDSPGQVVRVALTLGQDHPILRARLVGSDGEPLADRDVQWRVDDGDGMESDAGSDAAGVLLLHLAPYAAEGRGRELHLQVAAREGRPGGAAQLDLPDRLPPGPTDLGDVHVAAGTPLVAGVVRGPHGAPIAGAEVHVDAVTTWGEDNRYFENLDLGLTSAADGTFVAWGADPGRPLRVTARQGGLASRSHEVPVGSSGLVLDLLVGGSVAGRFLFGEGIEAADFDARLHPSGPGGLNDWLLRVSADLDREGRFELGTRRPGTYDLWLDGPGGGSDLLALEGLEVPSGEACPDPRLEAIDLRGRVLALRVRLLTPEPGAPVRGTVEVRPVRDGATDDETETEFLQGGELRLLVEARAVDLTVDVLGYRRVELRDVRGDVEVALRPGPPVRLRIPGDVVLPSPPRYLKAYLTPDEEGSVAFGHFLDAVFDERREVLLHAPSAGRLQVHWLLEERTQNTLSTSDLGDDEEGAWVEVLDRDTEQVFEVEPPRQALADRLRDG